MLAKIENKVCRECGITKPASEYYKHYTNRDGCATYCKACTSLIGRRYYNANREKIQVYRDANKERTKTYNRMYKAVDPEKTRARGKAEREKHSEHYKKQGVIYRKTYKEEIRVRNKLYNQIGMKVARKMLSNTYIKSLLTKHGSILSFRDVPTELVAAKRIQIQIKRELKKQAS